MNLLAESVMIICSSATLPPPYGETLFNTILPQMIKRYKLYYAETDQWEGKAVYTLRMKLKQTNFVFALVMSLILFGWNERSVAAEAVVIVPLQLQQGTLISAKIPQFIDGFDPAALSQHNEKFRQLVFSSLADFEQIAVKTRLAPNLPEQMKNALTLIAEYEVCRNDQQVVSLVQRIYQYTGGAHGMTWQTGSTVDRVTGNSWTLADLFVPGSDYSGRLTEIVRQVGAERKLPLWDFKGIGPQSAFSLSDEGLVLFFQPYEIAPYSEGIVKIVTPYSTLRDIFRAELQQ